MAPENERALEILKKVLPAADYYRMESECKNGLGSRTALSSRV